MGKTYVRTHRAILFLWVKWMSLELVLDHQCVRKIWREGKGQVRGEGRETRETPGDPSQPRPPKAQRHSSQSRRRAALPLGRRLFFRIRCAGASLDPIARLTENLVLPASQARALADRVCGWRKPCLCHVLSQGRPACSWSLPLPYQCFGKSRIPSSRNRREPRRIGAKK